MNANDYQKRTENTAVYKKVIDELLYPIELVMDVRHDAYVPAKKNLDKIEEILNLFYVVLGLAGEAGEVANKAKKVLRDGLDKEVLLGELRGDLWYSAQLLNLLNSNFEEQFDLNISELESRASRGTLHGSGDVR